MLQESFISLTFNILIINLVRAILVIYQVPSPLKVILRKYKSYLDYLAKCAYVDIIEALTILSFTAFRVITYLLTRIVFLVLGYELKIYSLSTAM